MFDSIILGLLISVPGLGTNKVLESYPYTAIMLITGYKTEKAFLRYVKISGYGAIKIFKQLTDIIRIAVWWKIRQVLIKEEDLFFNKFLQAILK